ncbi:hypothetical protein U9M48_031005 [Paspalum notatum var. saurae]|uniref:Uncharacterized protein n=1 Tax=Paspalum notatum var. saurae TaxID=547442 RepID=A0AAQ3U1Q0_PASNO
MQTSEAYYKQATFFTMHHLVHDLAISLLGTEVLDQSQQSNNRGSDCKYALLSDGSKPLEVCLTSRARLIALRFLDDCRSKVISGAISAPASRSLQVLDLNGCSVELLDSIGQLKQLRYLNAPRIQAIMVPKSITNLSNLVYLNLHKSRILQLPESFGEMGSLMHLDLSACFFLQLKFSVMNLERLVHLDLSNCHDIEPKSLQSLSRLEHLNLSWYRSTGCLPRALGGLTELQYLNISHASCFGLQEVLVNLTKLRYLNLKASLNDRLIVEAWVDNLLECVSSLSNLEYLNLGSNRELFTIPETIGNLRKLNTLDLSFCENLQRLPASISAICSLKFLHIIGSGKIDKSSLPQNKNNSALLPHFVVHANDGEPSSNIYELEDKHPTLLEINRLENVKSAEEVNRIKLAEKQSIGNLELAWTRVAKRCVDDQEVLSKLEPPGALKILTLKGYSSISFPSWMMNIATYLPHLEKVVLEDLPSCNVLPPLGQLSNLKWLKIQGMDSIRKIDADLYGGRRAFPRLVHFTVSHMENLEEWNMAYDIGKGGGSGRAEMALKADAVTLVV